MVGITTPSPHRTSGREGCEPSSILPVICPISYSYPCFMLTLILRPLTECDLAISTATRRCAIAKSAWVFGSFGCLSIRSSEHHRYCG